MRTTINRNIKGVAKIAEDYPGNCFLALLGDDPAAMRQAAARIISGAVGLADSMIGADAAVLADNLIEAAGRAAIGRPARIGCLDPFVGDALEAAAVFNRCAEYIEKARAKTGAAEPETDPAAGEAAQ